MNKQDLIKSIAEETSLTRGNVEHVLNVLAGTVRDELGSSGEFTLPGVGKLKAKERPARTGRNPQTGEAVQVAAKTVVKFAPAKSLTDTLN